MIKWKVSLSRCIVNFTDGECGRLWASMLTPEVFAAAQNLRDLSSFERDDKTLLFYTLVSIKDWCKNDVIFSPCRHAA